MDQQPDPTTNPIDLSSDRAPLLVEGEPVWERMAKLSRFCVELVKRHFGETLDHSPGSISQLDRIILSGWGDNIRVDEIDPAVIQTLGGYVGEILVRRTSGRWVSGLSDDDPGAILFINPDESIRLSFSPFLFVRQKFVDPYGFDLAVAWAILEQQIAEPASA
jgi:hypothetical protein